MRDVLFLLFTGSNYKIGPIFIAKTANTAKRYIDKPAPLN